MKAVQKAKHSQPERQARRGDTADTAALVQELQTRQVELELQNEALRQFQVDLEESRDRYVDFYDFAPVGFATLTDHGRIDQVNLTGAEMLGVERGELLQRFLSSFVVLEHSDRWQRHFARALRQDEKVTCELALRRPDGYRLEVRLDCLRRVTSGKAPILRLVLSDITAHKHIEEQLREMATSLEAKVEERTSRLRDLAIELSMTEDRERRLLAKDLHDDLGQLLAVIKIKLTSLGDGASQAQIDRIVELVDKAGQSARMITTRLSPPILHTLGFVPALEWLAEEMELMYGLHVHLAVDCRQINLDDHVQSMLHRSARELLINVARHAGVSDATLSCMCAGRRIMLMVSDDGCGFDPAELPGILTGHRSFGLGSINEHIARIGGHMEIDARPENGTTITLTLPCSTKDEACSNDPDRSCR